MRTVSLFRPEPGLFNALSTLLCETEAADEQARSHTSKNTPNEIKRVVKNTHRYTSCLEFGRKLVLQWKHLLGESLFEEGGCREEKINGDAVVTEATRREGDKGEKALCPTRFKVPVDV